MLSRTAHSPFPTYSPSGCMSRITCAHPRKSRGSGVPVAHYVPRGAFLLLIAAFTCCVLLFHSGIPLVAASGSFRPRSEQHPVEPIEGSRSRRPAWAPPAPWMRAGDDQATDGHQDIQIEEESRAREAARDAAAGAPQRPASETRKDLRRAGVRGALHPRDYPAQGAEGSEEKKAPMGTENSDVEAAVDVPDRTANDGRSEGRPTTDGTVPLRGETEGPLPTWPAQSSTAKGSQREGYETRKEKDERGDREASQPEAGMVGEWKASVKTEAKEEVERRETEEEDDVDSEDMRSSVARKHSADYGGNHEEHEGVEKEKRVGHESAEEKKEEQGKRTERKEKEKRQSSERSDAIVEKATDEKEKEEPQCSRRGDDIVEERPDAKAEGTRQSNRNSDATAEEGKNGAGDVHLVFEREGRSEERAIQSVYSRPFSFDSSLCLFPNSPWCNLDPPAQDAKSTESLPEFIKRANALVSSMMPLPYFYIPLSIPGFWGADEGSSVESGAARCRFTFTIDPMGPSEEILLYTVPSQRQIGLTVGRNAKHSETAKTYSGMYGTETRMHAVSSLAQACGISKKLLEAGLIGWSYAGKTDGGVKILVTFPSEAHAKELVRRKELSEESYKKLVEEEGLDALTPAEKCLLSGRTRIECEQMKKDADAKRSATITISTDGYAENEVRIPEFVYE